MAVSKRVMGGDANMAAGRIAAQQRQQQGRPLQVQQLVRRAGRMRRRSTTAATRSGSLVLLVTCNNTHSVLR